jgi:hypothetical protein
MANFTWTNAAGGDWSVPSNWDAGAVPDSGANIVLPTLATAYTSIDDIPFIDGLNLSLGNSVTLIIAEGETSVENINAFGTNSLFETEGNAIVSIGNGLGGAYAVDGPTASLDITGFNGIGTFDLFSGTISFGNNANLSAGNSFDFEGDSIGKLAIASANNYQNGWSFPVTGFSLLDTIALGTNIFVPGTYTNAYDAAAHTLTIPKAGGGSYVFNNFSTAAGAPTTFLVTGTTVTDVVCYVRGTMIQTPTGELPIETLRPAMQVITLVEGNEVPRPVKWVGHRRIDLTRHPRPEAMAPIRVERDAFADNVPHTDLLLSPDHAVSIDGMLFCIRQLVNGSTIRTERGWTAVDYYHVELNDHSILLAEGLPAESYLDTGNRAFFANSGAPLVLHPDLPNENRYPTRQVGSCAPFVWDEAGVRPVWQRLADRAAGIGRPVPQRVTTTEADLRLLADQRTVRSVFSDSDRVIFVLPCGASEVRLLSRAQSPTEARPWLDDRRRLGVRVKRIVLRGADELREIPLDHPDLTRGWWAVERNGQVLSRWTDGEAVLPLPAMRGTVMLELHLAGPMVYVEEAASEGATERLAAA